MDRIISARIDDRIYKKINDLSVKMNTSKKSVIEKAIELLGKAYQESSKTDVFEETCGIWKRTDSPEKIFSIARGAFNKSLKRHKR